MWDWILLIQVISSRPHEISDLHLKNPPFLDIFSELIFSFFDYPISSKPEQISSIFIEWKPSTPKLSEIPWPNPKCKWRQKRAVEMLFF